MTGRRDLTATRFLTDRVGVSEELLAAGADLAALLRQLPPEAAAAPVPGLRWTVAETAAHVVTVVRRSLGDTRRSASPDQTPALNQLCLGELSERDPRRLADLLDAELPVVVGRVMPRFPDDLPVDFHGGITARLLTAYGIMLMDLVVHRWDIAVAVGGDGEPRDGAARLALQAVLEVLPAWVDPAGTGALDVVVRVERDAAYRVRLAGGVLDVGPGDAAIPGPRVRAGSLLLALSGRVAADDPDLARLCAALLPL